MMTHPAPTVRVCHVGTVIVLVSLDRGADGTWRARHSPTGASWPSRRRRREAERALGFGDRGADSDGLRAHGRDGMSDPDEIARLRAQVARLQRAVAHLDTAYAGEYGGNSTHMDAESAEWLGLEPDDVPDDAYRRAREMYA